MSRFNFADAQANGMTNFEISKTLLKIAKSDLKASKLLYTHGCYSQSIFSLQQATEKGNKALAFYGDFLTLPKAKSVGHIQSKLVKEILRQHLIEVEQSTAVEPTVPNFFGILREFNFDFSAYQAQIAKIHDDLNWMNNETELSNLTAVRLDKFISLIDSIYSISDHLGKGKLFVGIQSYILEFLNKLRQSEEIGSGGTSFLNQELEMDETEISKLFALILVKAINVGQSAASLAILGFIFDRLISKVRYPEVQEHFYFDPTKVFNKKLPLIKKLPEFHFLVNRSLREIDKQINLSGNPPGAPE